MTGSDWLQLAALVMVALLILPAALRLPQKHPGKNTRLLAFAAIWLAIFAGVALLWRLLN